MRNFFIIGVCSAALCMPLSVSALTIDDILVQVDTLRDAINDAQSQIAAAAQPLAKLRSRARVVRDPIPAALRELGVVPLLRFKISAAQTGDVKIGLMTAQIFLSGMKVSNVDLYAYTDASYTSPIPGFTSGLIGDGVGEWHSGNGASIGPSTAVQIPAGATYYFELRAEVDNAAERGSIQTLLLGDDEPAELRTFLETIQAGNRFVWSPMSTSTSSYTNSDWTNGYFASMRNNLSQRLQYVGERSIRVRSPNGGETWVATPKVTDTISGYERYKRDIKWSGAADSGGYDGKVLAYLEDASGKTVGRIPAFAYGSIAWVVGLVNPNPNCGTNAECVSGELVLVPPDEYYVRLVDTSNDTTDKSDAPFSIVSEQPYACTGAVPPHATLCAGDNSGLTMDTPRMLVSACSSPAGSAPKCQYVCLAGYKRQGGACVPDQELKVGDDVQSIDRLVVRDAPAGARIGVQRKGSLGFIVNGPVTRGKNTWWEVNWAAGANGWSAEDYLLKITSIPITESERDSQAAGAAASLPGLWWGW